MNVTESTTARLRYFFVSPRTSNMAFLSVERLDAGMAELFQAGCEWAAGGFRDARWRRERRRGKER